MLPERRPGAGSAGAGSSHAEVGGAAHTGLCAWRPHRCVVVGWVVAQSISLGHCAVCKAAAASMLGLSWHDSALATTIASTTPARAGTPIYDVAGIPAVALYKLPLLEGM